LRVLTVAESRAFDRRAMEGLGIPGLVLMENAALGVVEALASRWPSARRIGIVCGAGNNGADGVAVARQLRTRGYDLHLFAAGFGGRRSPDCEAQFAVARGIGLPVETLENGFDPAQLAPLALCDVVVDALFGVGLTRPLEGEWARVLSCFGEAPRLAIDLPSGLDGDRAAPIGPAARADLTVTFVAPKPAHVLDPACDLCGEVVVADLGLPFDGVEGAGALHLLDSEELSRALPRRDPASHKGSFGHVLLVAGGTGKVGAAVLAARAAVAGGAGLTTVAVPPGLVEALAAGCPEAMTFPSPATPAGSLALAALPSLLAAAAERSVLAIGPGLGREPETGELVVRLATGSDRPLVLDADGLSAFEGRLELLAHRAAPTVLTPHPGELARLVGRSTQEIQADRLASVRDAAERSGAVVALKGRRTLIAAPDGESWVNDTGNAGMASGGSGDVLTGLVAARLAQGDSAEFAAALAVHLHGLAGDRVASRGAAPAVPASDLAAELGVAYWELAALAEQD